jgi:predicted small secreted protein
MGTSHVTFKRKKRASVQVYSSWAEMWSKETGGSLLRISMHTHIFLLPVPLLDSSCNTVKGVGEARQVPARCIMLRMCSVALGLRDVVDKCTASAELVAPYRCCTLLFTSVPSDLVNLVHNNSARGTS